MVGGATFSPSLVWELFPAPLYADVSWLDLPDVIQRLSKHHLLLIINLNFSFQAYSNLLRAHMDGLKKKDKKSKSKKTKATQWATDSLT